MGKLKDVPNYIKKVIADNDITIDNCLFFEKADMSSGGDVTDNYVMLDKNSLIVIDGRERIIPVKGGKEPEVFYNLFSIKRYLIREINELTVDLFLSTGRLTAVTDSEIIEICSFSMSKRVGFDRMCRIFEAWSKDEDEQAERLIEETPQDVFCPDCGTRYPRRKRKICPKCTDKFSIFGRLLKYLFEYKNKVFVIMAFMLINSGFNIISPYLSNKLLFDEVLTRGGKYYGQIGLIVGVIFAVKLIGTVLGIAFSYLVSSIMPKMIYDIKMKIFVSMQRLSVSFYTSKQTGNLMSRVNRDANQIYWFFVDGLPYAVVNVFTFTGILTMMLLMNPMLAAVTVVMVPAVLISFRVMWKYFRSMHHRNWVFNSAMTSFLNDALSGQRVIRAFAKEESENARFSGISRQMSDANLHLNNTEMTFFPLVYLFMFFGQVIVTAVGAVMIFNGKMEIGTLLTFIMYLTMLYQPMEFMSWFSNWWGRCVDAAQRMFEVIDAEPEIIEAENPINIEELDGNIELKNVYFEYEPSVPIIKNISLSVKDGDFLGIVGKAGVGKSTLANLVARLYEVREGDILIDGHSVRDLKQEVLHKNVGVVSQEIFIFMGTIADNIRYAKPDADIEEVVAAAKSASAHEFIMNLPDAYETRVGSGGQDLSGGEKQRLSIARTILQNPKILILDEATASMDTETERKIQTSIDKLKHGRTTLAIAHRLSTLRDADYIAVVDGGKIVEYGTHEELIHKKGEFYNLYKIQTDALKKISI